MKTLSWRVILIIGAVSALVTATGAYKTGGQVADNAATAASAQNTQSAISGLFSAASTGMSVAANAGVFDKPTGDPMKGVQSISLENTQNISLMA